MFTELKSGWLLRQTTILKKWKSYYFKLISDGNLIFYQDENNLEKVGHFNLISNCKSIKGGLACQITPPSNHTVESVIKLESKNGDNLVLCSSSTDEALAWRMTMNEMLEQTTMYQQKVPRIAKGYQTRRDLYYIEAYGPVEVGHDSFGRVYYVCPQNQQITYISENDPNYYRKGYTVYGLGTGLMLWTPFIFF